MADPKTYRILVDGIHVEAADGTAKPRREGDIVPLTSEQAKALDDLDGPKRIEAAAKEEPTDDNRPKASTVMAEEATEDDEERAKAVARQHEDRRQSTGSPPNEKGGRK